MPGHVLFDARVAFDDPVAFGRGLGLRGFVSVNNLTGRRYIGSAYLNPDVLNGEAVAFEPGRPREVVVGLTVGAL